MIEKDNNTLLECELTPVAWHEDDSREVALPCAQGRERGCSLEEEEGNRGENAIAERVTSHLLLLFSLSLPYNHHFYH